MNATPLPLTVYGGHDCDDTEGVVARLNALHIPHRLILIDDNPDAEHFVVFINNGYRSTPTLVFGDGNRKMVLTEPAEHELVDVLRSAGYPVQ